jgi:hypothetical protein
MNRRTDGQVTLARFRVHWLTKPPPASEAMVRRMMTLIDATA